MGFKNSSPANTTVVDRTTSTCEIINSSCYAWDHFAAVQYVLLPSATHLKVEQRCNIYNLTHYSYSRYKAVLSIAIIGRHFLVLIANCTITWLQYWNHSLTCYIPWNSCTTLLTLLLLSSEWVSVQWTYNIVWKCNTITINNSSEQQNTVWSSVFTYAGLPACDVQ